MKRLIAAAFLFSAAAVLHMSDSGAAQLNGVAPSVGTAPSSSWACIAIEHVDLGVCQGNPLPSRLPVDVPDVPAV